MRFLHVLNKELHDSRKGFIIYGITIFLVMFVVEVIAAIVSRFTGSGHIEIYEGLFPGFLFLGGFITTSVMFSDDMFSKRGQHAWMMLPASSLEKFLSKALLSAFAYPIALVLVFAGASAFTELFTLITVGDHFVMFNPLQAETWKMVLHFLVIQSVFLLGATYFRSVHFIKTVLAVGLIVTVAGLFAALIARIAFAPYLQGFFSPKAFHLSADINDLMKTTQGLSIVVDIVYWALLAPFCWFTAYLRVKEVQATDAIQ
ncbi:MAG: hypothetical protein WC129_04370 [Sphaerochaetaceae bacterium]